jgi:hypothetical protein
MSVTGLRNASAPSPKQGRVHGTDRTGPILRAMITSQGYGLIAELIAAALLIAALTGLFQAVAGRGHDGIRDTHSGRDDSHRFIDLGPEFLQTPCGGFAGVLGAHENTARTPIGVCAECDAGKVAARLRAARGPCVMDRRFRAAALHDVRFTPESGRH